MVILGKAFKEAEEKGYKLPVVQFVEPYGTLAILDGKNKKIIFEEI